jgi:hypothetical protein
MTITNFAPDLILNSMKRRNAIKAALKNVSGTEQ